MNTPSTHRTLAISHLISGAIVCLLMILAIANLDTLMEKFYDFILIDLPEFGWTTFISWIMIALFNVIIFVSTIWFVALAPLLTYFFIITIGIPSIICGQGLLMEKKWASTATKVVSFLYLILFPIGTAFGIWSLVRLRRK
jgi:hypothetical protein